MNKNIEYRAATLEEIKAENKRIDASVKKETVRKNPHRPGDYSNSISDSLYKELERISAE